MTYPRFDLTANPTLEERRAMVAKQPMIGALIADDGQHFHGVFTWRQTPHLGDKVASAICEHLHADLEAALGCANQLGNLLLSEHSGE